MANRITKRSNPSKELNPVTYQINREMVGAIISDEIPAVRRDMEEKKFFLNDAVFNL